MLDVSAMAMADLPSDHPGITDQNYRRRRTAIALAADEYEPGRPIPRIDYTAEEREVWHTVSTELGAKHHQLACAAYLDAADRLALPTDEVPQLDDVSGRLAALTGFRIAPVPGLVPTRRFYGSLADRCFLSTQYIRHHSAPFYTPEPDVIHELIGHANALGGRDFAQLYELAGQASRRATTEEALDFFSRVFWFTIEFGLVWERGELRTYGAGLLSSYGEIDAFRSAEVRPFDIEAMGTQHYDIAAFQPILFAAESFDQVVTDLGSWFDRFGR